jgi:hypothetical protein
LIANAQPGVVIEIQAKPESHFVIQFTAKIVES